MKKTINRTFIVKEGRKLVPNDETRSFDEQHVTIFDNEPVPENVQIESTTKIRATMPLETFFDLAEKHIISADEEQMDMVDGEVWNN